MPVSFVRGDLFATPWLSAFAHGCNCAGRMGAGIAVEFKRRWPRIFEEYRRRCRTGEFQLGDVFVWEESGKTVFNLGTQPHWRAPAQIDAIGQSVETMGATATSHGIIEIGLPRIGAGFGGLAWEEVKRVIQEVGRRTGVTLLVLEKHFPGMVAELL